MTQGVTERLVYALDRALLDGTTTVAVKKFRCTTLRAEDAQSYMREIATLRYRRDTHLVAQTTPFPSSHMHGSLPPSPLRHVNIIALYGVAVLPPWLVSTDTLLQLPSSLTHTPPPNSAL